MARRGENIRQRKDKRWEGRYTVRSKDGTKPHVRSVYGKSYKEVKIKLAEAKRNAEKFSKTLSQKEDMIEENKSGAYIYTSDFSYVFKKQSIQFNIVAKEWLSYVLTAKKYSTYVKYRQVYFKYLKDFLNGQPVECFLSEEFKINIMENAASVSNTKVLSDSIEKSICCVVNQILLFASEKYHISVNLIKRESIKINKKPVEIFNLSEQQKLMDFLNKDTDMYKFGIIICLYTGLRIGELCGLKWEDIDMKNRIIHVRSTVQRLPVKNPVVGSRKTELMEMEPKSFFSKREIPICDVLYEMLERFKHSGKYVVGVNKMTDPRSYQKKFAAYLTAAGIDYRSFHTLRHTFASNCAASGMETKALSEILGHSDVKTTLNKYVHPSMEAKLKSLNVMCISLSGQNLGKVS